MRYTNTPQQYEAVRWTANNWAEIAAFEKRPIAITANGTLMVGWDGHSDDYLPVPVGSWIVRNVLDGDVCHSVKHERFQIRF